MLLSTAERYIRRCLLVESDSMRVIRRASVRIQSTNDRWPLASDPKRRRWSTRLRQLHARRVASRPQLTVADDETAEGTTVRVSKARGKECSEADWLVSCDRTGLDGTRGTADEGGEGGPEVDCRGWSCERRTSEQSSRVLDDAEASVSSAEGAAEGSSASSRGRGAGAKSCGTRDGVAETSDSVESSLHRTSFCPQTTSATMDEKAVPPCAVIDERAEAPAVAR